jgi:hypothetical protein
MLNIPVRNRPIGSQILVFLWSMSVAPAPGCSRGGAPATDDAGARMDLLPAGGGDAAGPADLSPPSPKRIFVTAQSYPGNLVKTAGGTMGLASADSLCGQAASGAHLGGSWKAWLSDGSHNAIDRIADVAPWQLVGSGATAFTRKADLAAMPAVSINLDETGSQVGAGAYAWTATDTKGLFSMLDCYDWTSSNPGDFGNMGNPNGLGDWSQATGLGCNGAYHLYCLEQ